MLPSMAFTAQCPTHLLRFYIHCWSFPLERPLSPLPSPHTIKPLLYVPAAPFPFFRGSSFWFGLALCFPFFPQHSAWCLDPTRDLTNANKKQGNERMSIFMALNHFLSLHFLIWCGTNNLIPCDVTWLYILINVKSDLKVNYLHFNPEIPREWDILRRTQRVPS